MDNLEAVALEGVKIGFLLGFLGPLSYLGFFVAIKLFSKIVKRA